MKSAVARCVAHGRTSCLLRNPSLRDTSARGADLHALALQHFTDLGEQCDAQPVLVVLEQAAELKQGAAVGNTLAAPVDAHEAAWRGAVQQRFLTNLVGKVESVLHGRHAQPALQAEGGRPLPAFR